MTKLHLISFGFGHGPAPAGTQLLADIRTWFRDPHIDPRLRKLTGLDEEVVDKVLNTENVVIFLLGLEQAARAVLLTGCDVTLAVGCVGGRHRSVVITDTLEQRLAHPGWTVEKTHRDIDKDVIRR